MALTSMGGTVAGRGWTLAFCCLIALASTGCGGGNDQAQPHGPTLKDLTAVRHRLIAVLALGDHVPLDPWAVDTVFFTVVEGGR